MRIVVASTHVPFVRGGGTRIVDDVNRCLSDAGHEIDIVSIPVWETWQELPVQLLAMRLFELAESCDRLIALRTPSHLLRHPEKVVWFLHHHRGAYDLWGTEYQDIPDTEEGRRVRDTIRTADDQGFREAHRIYANSPTSQERLRRFSDIDAEVLYPPLSDADLYRCEPAERYVVFPSRITTAKRQVLALEAMAHVRSGVRLVVAGPPDGLEALLALRAAVERFDVGDRVTLLPRWLPENEKRDLLARCLGCVFVPFDEDSYGYVGLEACQSGKPLITCDDSGGVPELVVDGETGYVVEPLAEAIGEAIDRLARSPAAAAEMGRAARERPEALGVSWPRVVEALTA